MLVSWKTPVCTIITFIILLPHIKATPPPLPFEWNPSAKANKFNFFSLQATYTAGTAFDDSTLVGLARQAYRTMTADESWQNMIKKPGTVCALKVDNEIFFSSSISGGSKDVSSFVYDWLEPEKDDYGEDAGANIQQQLIACQIFKMEKKDFGKDKTTTGHRTGGNCAEVMAVHLYQVAHPGEDITKKEGAVVAAYGIDGYGDYKGTEIGLPACGGAGPEWGCQQLMEYLNIRPIGKTKQGQMTDMTAAPISTNNQLSLCDQGT